MFFHHILLIKSARHRRSVQIFQIATEVEEEVMDKKKSTTVQEGWQLVASLKGSKRNVEIWVWVNTYYNDICGE